MSVLKVIVRLSVLLCFLICFLVPQQTKASHAAGGELIYEWVSDSTYRFIFKFYRDCGGVPEPNSVSMCYSNSCNATSGNLTLTKMTSLPNGGSNGQQVSTGCANTKNKCDSAASTIPGYREWWYSNTFTLPSRCTSWRFYVGVNARNPSQNLVGTGVFYVEAILNNQDVQDNSSPTFSVKPVPFVCINQSYNYNNGGVDPNNDSMTFEVITPLQIGGGCPSNPVSKTYATKTPSLGLPSNPFQTNNTFLLDTITGQLTFTPSELGAQTVTIKVKEYRNGVLIGSVMRDIQVQVIMCTSTTPTVSTDPTTLTGSQFINNRVVGCAGKPLTFCYDIKSTDTAANLVVTDNHTAAAPGSSTSYANAPSDSVRGCFTWTPGPTDTGTRVFAVTVKDSSCASGGVPITQTFLVPIYIWAVTSAIKDTSICIGDSVQLNAVGGTGYIWSVISGGSPISSLSCTTCKQPFASPTVTTSYIVTSNSSPFCNSNTDTLTVTVNNPPAPSISSNTPVCPGSTLNLFATATGATAFEWLGPNSFTSTAQNPTITNAQIANSGIYAVRAVVNTCTTQYASTNAFVGYPNAPVASSNSPVCENTDLNLTASFISGTVTYSWTGPNGYTSTTQNPTLTGVKPINAGQYIVSATVNGCNSLSDTVNVTVNPAPDTPIAASPVIYCEDVTATALSATGSNLRWYTVATGGSPLTSAPVPNTSTPGTTTYWVTQTDNINICESPRKEVNVIVLAKPMPPTVSPIIYYCQNATASALTATGTNLKWYTVATGGTPLAGAPTPLTNTAGNTTYWVTQTDGSGCESDRAAITVTVFPTPANPTVSSPVNYCQFGSGLPGLATFVTGTSIKWYTSSTGGTGSSSPPAISTATAGTTTYWVTQTINGCESNRQPIVAIIHAKPAPPIVSDTSLCQFTTPIQLTANGQNLRWYATATGGFGSSIAPTPSTTTVGSTKYYVSQTVNGCESDRDSIEVTIIAEPPIPTGVDVTYCQFETAQPLGATGLNLKWYTTFTGGTPLANTPIPATTVANTFYWYVSQTINGCESQRDSVRVIILPKPVPPTVDSLEYCLNIVAPALTATGQNLLWYIGPTGGIGTATAPVPNTSTVGTINYYVSQTVNGCESDRAALAVKTDTSVTARIIFNKTPVCQHDTLSLWHEGVIPDSSTFDWGFDGGVIVSGDTAGPYTLKWDTAGKKTITLNAYRQGCRATDTQTLYVLPVPEASFDMQSEACINQEVMVLPDTGLAHAVNYTWDLKTATKVDSMNNGYKVKWTTAGEKVISLFTISDTGCLSPTVYDTINIREFPMAVIDSSNQYDLCIRTEIELTAQYYPQYKYLWEPEKYFTSNNSNTAKAIIPSAGYVRVNVTDDIGCTGMDSVYVGVHMCCQIYFPDAFSPNGDGKNDIFRIISGGRHTIKSFIVLNRYGQRVFVTTNPSEGWDGTFKGIPQDIGTYYYFIRYVCNDDNADNEIEQKGSIILVR